MDRASQNTGRNGGRGRGRTGHTGRGRGPQQEGGRGGRGGDRSHNRAPTTDDTRAGGHGAGRDRSHAGSLSSHSHSQLPPGSPRRGAPDSGPTPAEATPRPSPTKGPTATSRPTASSGGRPQVSTGAKPGSSWAQLLKPGPPAVAVPPGPGPTTAANNIASATSPAAPSATAIVTGTVSTPTSATSAAAIATSSVVPLEATSPQSPSPTRVAAEAAARQQNSPAGGSSNAEGAPVRPSPQSTSSVAAKPSPAPSERTPAPRGDYAAALSADPSQAPIPAPGSGTVASAVTLTPSSAPAVAGVPASNVPAGIAAGSPRGAAVVPSPVPMVAAGSVPISVGPIHNMPMPAIPAIGAQGPAPGTQTMPGIGRGQGAAMSPRPNGPVPAFAGGAVMPGPGPRPAPGTFVPNLYATAHMQQYGARMVPAFHMHGMAMANTNPRMGPHYGQPMMPMATRPYKQGHPGNRNSGRNAGGAAAAAAPAGSSNAANVTDGAGPGADVSRAARGAGQVAASEPQKTGLRIHRAGPGGGPARSRPQSAIEPRSTTPTHGSFDSEGGKQAYTPRSQPRSTSAISHRSETGTPTLDSTPKKLAIRKPGGTPSKSPEKTERPTSAMSTQSTASPCQPQTTLATTAEGSPDENECPKAQENGAVGATPTGAAPTPLPTKSSADAAADAAAAAACASVAASSTAAVAAREPASTLNNDQSVVLSPPAPEELPPPPPAQEPAATPADTPAQVSVPTPPAQPVAAEPAAPDTSTVQPSADTTTAVDALPPPPPRPQPVGAEPAAPKVTQLQPPADVATADVLPPPPPNPPQAPSSSSPVDSAPPPPTPAQRTEPASSGPVQAKNGASKMQYTREFMCAVQNIPGESMNKFGITQTREDLRALTFDLLEDSFIGQMHRLLHKDDSGIIATEESRQRAHERQGNLRMRRTGSHANRGDERGGRTSGGRGGGMWGDDHMHGGRSGGRGGGGRSGLADRQGSGQREDQWNRKTGGYNQAASGSGGSTGTFSEWSQNKKAAPPPPGAQMVRAKNAYKLRNLTSDDPEEEAKQREFTSLINKLTIDNFDRIVARMGTIDVQEAKTLTGFVEKIFNKALAESIFCEMYALLCKELLRLMPRFKSDNESAAADGKKKVQQDVRSLVLSECQYHFTRGRVAKTEEASKEPEEEADLTEQEKKIAKAKRDEENLQVRRRAMGNMQFVGHLYKVGMITEKIVHVCFQELLKEPTSEEVECACKLLTTAGPYLQTMEEKRKRKERECMQNAKHNPELFPVYIDRLEAISKNKDKFDSRIRFLILDTLELANNSWQGRTKSEGPRKIEDIHKDAMAEEQRAKLRSNPRSGYNDPRSGYNDRHGGHGGHGHGMPQRPPQMDMRVQPRPMNTSMLNSVAATSGRPGGLRRNAHTSDRQNEPPREQHGGRHSHSGSGVWSRPQPTADRDSGPPAPHPPPPPRQSEEPPAAPADVQTISREDVRRKVKLMLGEFESSPKSDEAVLSCKELLQKNVSASAVQATILCELTCMYKDEAQFSEKRDMWLEMLVQPLSPSCTKDVLTELMEQLPELLDENIKAVKLIGTSIGGMLETDKLTPRELFEKLTESHEEGEDSQLVDADHAAALFMTAVTNSHTDLDSLKASASIDAKALLPSYTHKKLQEHAAKTGLDQLLSV